MLFTMLLLGPLFVLAQDATREIKGTVTDNNGGPLQGVSVLVKGKSTGTATNNAGMYTVKADARHGVVAVAAASHVVAEFEAAAFVDVFDWGALRVFCAVVVQKSGGLALGAQLLSFLVCRLRIVCA